MFSWGIERDQRYEMGYYVSDNITIYVEGITDEGVPHMNVVTGKADTSYSRMCTWGKMVL